MSNAPPEAGDPPLADGTVLVDCRLMYRRRAGISNYTRRLVQALAKCAPELALAVLLDRRDTDVDWIPSRVTVWRALTPAHHRYEALALPLELALIAARLYAQGRKSTPAGRAQLLVHFPDFIACRGPFKKVITIHDLYFMEHPEVMSADGRRYYGGIGQSVLCADAVIAVSAFTRADVLRLLPQTASDKLHVVLEAGDDHADSVVHDPSRAHHTPRHVPYALFVGTFEPRKNLSTLLRALPYTPLDLKVVIVGEAGWGAGDEPAELVRQLGLIDRVGLTGRVSDAELDRLYRQARLLVFPSLSEGFGLPALEAMSRGIPVICSNTGSLPEIVGDAALTHDPLDVQQLAGHLTRLWLEDDLHAEYRARGLRRAAQFSWQRAAQETRAIYVRAMGASPSA